MDCVTRDGVTFDFVVMLGSSSSSFTVACVGVASSMDLQSTSWLFHRTKKEDEGLVAMTSLFSLLDFTLELVLLSVFT